MKSLLLIPVFVLGLSSPVLAQKTFGDYLQVYPIGEPPTISLRSSYARQERILFDANPIVRYSFSNNFIKGLQNNANHTRAYYISFRPHLRMYTDASLPVKTPSYRILLGSQHLFRLKSPGSSQNAEQFIGVSVESGHYSNGQSGCAFSPHFEDGAPECEAICRAISPDTDLSKLLNRRSGNFSTNMTELILEYQLHRLDEDYITAASHALRAGAVVYHDRFLGIGPFGGYSDQDIKIYGRMRYLLGYTGSMVTRNGAGRRLSFSENIELISGAHPSVNPLRLESTFVYYPSKKRKALGVFFTHVYGHDNYNFRFVDSGHQAGLGILWSQYPSITMRGGL